MAKDSQTFDVGSSRVTVRIGNLLDSGADVVVSSDDHRLSMNGGVSRAIREAAGPEYADDVRREAARLGELSLGRVVPTNAGTLRYKKVFHAVSRLDGHPNAPDLAATEVVIERAVTDSIRQLELLESRSIAFAAIGTGYARHSPLDVATAFARVLAGLLSDGKKVLDVEIVLGKDAFVSDVNFIEFFLQFADLARWTDKVVRDHAVVMVHGIRTGGEWMERVALLLRNSDRSVNGIPVGYQFFDVVSFLLPVPWFRNRVIERIGKELLRASELPATKKLSIVAHSFGTYIVTEALRSNPTLQAHCVVLCGSVVPVDFDWQGIDGQLRDIDTNYPGFRVINDCGWRDIWPVFAETITWGYGSSGRFGFQTGSVKDRFHNLAHSEFFDEAFIRRFWVPAIVEGRIVESAEQRPKGPWLLQVLTRFHLKYLILIGLVIAAWACFG